MIINFIQRYWLFISVITLSAITVLSLYPVASLPPVPGSDKTHHLIGYAALIFPLALKQPKHWPSIAVFFFVWSGIIELIQPHVNRYGEWLDLAANGAGLVIGILLANCCLWLVNQPKK